MTNEASPYYLRIERYVNGEMTPAERHTLEKEALDDPFLAEAIDGFQQTPVNVQNDVAELHGALAAYVAKQPRITVPKINYVKRIWWAAAAAVFLGGFWASYRWMGQRDEATLAKAEDIVQDSIVHNPADVKQEILPDSTIAPAAVLVTEKQSPKTITAPKGVPATVPTEKEVPQALQLQAADEIIADAPVAARLRRAQIPEAQEGTAMIPHFVQGYVQDTAGNAVPFAQVILPGTATTTASDVNGFFSIPTLDTSLEVQIKARQFATTSQILNAKQASVVVLQPLPTEKHPPIVKDNMEGDAIPVVGWAMYETYLTNNNKYDGSNQPFHKGTVELTFEVDQFGRPAAFNIILSSCTLCEKEAIRLIKEGPHWQITDGVAPVLVHLTLQF